MDEMCETVVPAKALSFSPRMVLQDNETIVDNTPRRSSKVWIKSGDVYESVGVTLGKSNRSLTEVSGIDSGSEVVVEVETTLKNTPMGGVQAGSNKETNPFAPAPRGGRKPGMK